MRKILLQMAVMAAFAGSNSISADYKISQRTTVEDLTTEVTVYAKGVRERREQKTDFGDVDEETKAMMAKMMPSLTTITQCDLKQDITINERKKAYFIDYYDWSALSPDKLKRIPDEKLVVKGTSTISAVVTDSGKRQQMFGLTARWLKYVMSFENSADSCDGKVSLRMEQEGWFVNLVLSEDTCRIPRPPESKGGCRPKLIYKSLQNPGLMLEGTTKSFENNKLESTTMLETTALTTAPLAQSLFEIPTDYLLVDSISDLFGTGLPEMGGPNSNQKSNISGDKKGTGKAKTIAIDFLTGNYSKVDQDSLRETIMKELNAKGFTARLVKSPGEITNGGFDFVISAEIVSAKQSKAGKLGGLFGKVTGDANAAKAGDSEIELKVTVYRGDGKTLIAQQPSKQKQSGSIDDAARSALETALEQIIDKIK